MKRIELTIADEDAQRMLSAIAEHQIVTLSVTSTDDDSTARDTAEAIAAYVDRTCEYLQENGRRNSALTGAELAKGIRDGAYLNLNAPAAPAPATPLIEQATGD